MAVGFVIDFLQGGRIKSVSGGRTRPVTIVHMEEQSEGQALVRHPCAGVPAFVVKECERFSERA